MFTLVERCLRDEDDGAWVELWDVFESCSAGQVRHILAQHGVALEDADAVVTRFWQELSGSGSSGSGSSGSGSSGSGSFFGDESAVVANEPSPPKNVPDPLEPRAAVKSPDSSCGQVSDSREQVSDSSCGRASRPDRAPSCEQVSRHERAITGEPSCGQVSRPDRAVAVPSQSKDVPHPLQPLLRSFTGNTRRDLKQWLVDKSVLFTLKLVEAGKVLLGEAGKKKPKRIESRVMQFESLEARQMLAVDLLSFQLAEDTGTLGDNITSNPTIEANVTGDFSGGHVEVEFDNYADGIVEQTMTVYTPGEEVSYDPRSFDASINSHDGPFTIRHRTVEYDSGYNVVSTSDWQDFNFTLEQLPDVDIQVYDEWYTTIDDGVGSVDVGSTSIGAALSHTLEITNYGSDDLTLDSASLTLPSGFQLVSGFDATVPQYSSTYLTIELNAGTEGYYTGTLAFATNDPDSPIFDFTVSGQVTNDPPEIDVQDEFYYDIADGTGSFDFGTTSLGTAVTATFTIYNYGYGQLQLDRPSLTLPSGFEVVSEFAETVASYDSTTLTIRMLADQVGSPSGQLSFTTNDTDESTFNFTIQGFVDDGTSQQPPEIDVQDESYYDIADGTGSVDYGQTTAGTAVSKTFTINNTGEADLTLSSLFVPAGYSVTSPFDTTVVGSSSTSFTVQLDATTAGNYDGEISFTTNDPDEATFNFAVSAVVDPDPSQILVAVALANDTGTSSTDKNTSDPALSGSVTGDFAGGSVRVEFDHNSNGSAQGFVDVANSGDSFSYDPVSTDATLDGFLGVVPMKYRYVKFDSGNTVVETGPWQDFAFTLVQDPDTGPIRTANFGLFNDTLTDGDLQTTDPTLLAIVVGDFQDGSVQVEFDHNDDGVAEGQQSVSQTGSSVVYDPRLTDTELFGFIGQVSIKYRLVHLAPDDAVISAGDWTSFDFEMVAAPADISLSVYGLDLLYNTGESNGVPTGIDPTLTGSLISNLPHAVVEFDHDGDGVVDGSTSTEDSGEFTYDPGNLDQGQHTISVRPLQWDSSYGTFRAGEWMTFTFILEGAAIANVLELGLANDTLDLSSEGQEGSGEDNITRDPTLKGKLDSSSGKVSFVRIELDLTNDGTADADTWTDQYGNFVYKPQSLPEGYLTVQARGTRWDETTQAYLPGQWKGFTFTLAPAPLTQVDGLALLNDTGDDTTDLVTFDPMVTGTLSGHESLTAFARVEFDYDGNDEVDGSTFSDSTGEFIFTPLLLATGSVTLRARASNWDHLQGEYLAGEWQSLAFTLEAEPNDPIAVEQLALARDTLLPASERSDQNDGSDDLRTSDPTITGVVVNDGQVAYQTVEFDYDNDGTADASVQSGANGSFWHTPASLSPGEVTVSVRGREWDYAGGQYIDGAWTTFTFTYEIATNQTPTVSSISLRSDTGISHSDLITANPLLTGTVSDDGVLYGTPVEFDHNADGIADGVTFANWEGQFQYLPEPLSFGQVSISARAAQWDASGAQFLFGDWIDFTFTYEDQPNAAAVITDLKLSNDTGEDGGDGITTDATIEGRVINEELLSGIVIEADFDNDGVVDYSTSTDDMGEFSINADSLPYGAASIALRTSELDLETPQLLLGNWQSFSFTFEQQVSPLASIETLVLANDMGNDNTDLVTTDPSLAGTVAGLPSLDSGLSALDSSALVEFDHDGDGVVDGSVLTDSEGAFSYTPSGLEVGGVTIAARVKQYDSLAAPLFSGWTQVTFTLEDEANTALRVESFNIANDTGNSDSDGATADATVAGQLAGGESLAGVTVEIDIDGDGLSDDTVTTDASGAFTFTPENVPEGLVNISVRVVDPSSGSGLPGSGLSTSIKFVYSTDPDGDEAQALVTALDEFDGGWQLAQDTYTATVTTAQDLYHSTTQTLVGDFEVDFADLRAQSESTVKGLIAAAKSLINSAEQTKAEGVATAVNDLATTDLPNFTGNPVGYAQTEYSIGGAPPTAPNETLPQDTPAPPVQPPAYEGETFNLADDPAYQSAVDAAERAYKETVKQSEEALKQAYKDAQAAIEQKRQAENEAYNQNVDSADAERRSAFFAANSEINLVTGIAEHGARVATAEREYEAAFAQNLTVFRNGVQTLFAQ